MEYLSRELMLSALREPRVEVRLYTALAEHDGCSFKASDSQRREIRGMVEASDDTVRFRAFLSDGILYIG